MNSSLRVAIHTVAGDPVNDDQTLGERMTKLLLSALERGTPSPAGILVSDGQVDLVELRRVVAERVSVRRFLASLSRVQERQVDALGMMGVFRADEDGPRVAMVFLEWPDNRWWQWRALLDGDGAVLAESIAVRSAEDGDPMPPNIGRWWSLGRRLRMLQPVVPAVVH